MNETILFATDLDGTLLDRNCTVPFPYADILRKMLGSGLLFTTATGRHPKSAAAVLKKNGISLSVPAICLNGAVTWDMERDIPIATRPISPEPLEEAWDVVRSFAASPRFFVCDLERNVLTTYYLPETEAGGQVRCFVYDPDTEPSCAFAPFCERAPDPRTAAFTYFDSHEILSPIYEKLSAVKGIRTVYYASTSVEGMYHLEFYADGGGKGFAAKEVMRLCGAEKLYVFGDSENDIDMFSSADRCFAPENAAAEVQHAADEIIPSNSEGGVVRTVERYFSPVPVLV